MRIWAVSDDKAGNRRQAEALAEILAQRLHVEWESFLLQPRAPWRSLAPRWLLGAAVGLDPRFRSHLLEVRPTLVIGCGRIAALATRIAKRLVAAKTVQLLDPRMRSSEWDLSLLPLHDRPDDVTALRMLGSLHPIDDDWLEAGREEWPALGARPRPLGVVLLGGPTRHCRYRIEDLQAWLSRLSAVQAAAGGSLLLIASRRTPAEWRDSLPPGVASWWPGDAQPNPYRAALGWAERLWVSPDSVNLLCEAAATRAALEVLPVAHLEGRLRQFHQALQASGRLDGLQPIAPLRERSRLADQVIERLQLRPEGRSVPVPPVTA